MDHYANVVFAREGECWRMVVSMRAAVAIAGDRANDPARRMTVVL
jgi:hypothetical protein